MATILTKKSDTSSSVPLAADLTNAAGGAELAVNTADKRLYSKTSGGSVVELGTNPSALSLPNGTANGVPYLNGSKVLTSGSALTFDGTGLGIGTTTIPAGRKLVIDSGNIRLSNDYQIEWGGSTVGLYGNGSTNSLSFFTNTSEAMRLTSSGLGIGTSSPQGQLSIGSAASGQKGLTLDWTGSGGPYSVASFTADRGTGEVRNFAFTNFFQTWYTNNAERMRLDSSGNLGLGVTPSAWDSVFKSFDGGGSGCFGSLFFQANGDYTTALGSNLYYNGGWKYKATAAAGKYELKNNTHAWYTAPSGTAGNAISFTQAMTLDASGNLLLGVTSGVGGTPPSAGFIFERNGNIKFRTNGDNSFTQFINSSGGQTGGITTNGTSTAYNTTSDHRLKTVLGSITDSGTRIDALEPIEYEWKVDGSRTRGFLAHKFQEVYAGSVTGTKDAVDKEGKPVYQAMQASSSEVIADLVAEIQSLRKRLAAAGI